MNYVILPLIHACVHLTDFIEVPLHQICEPNEEAVFKCGHQSAHAHINWRVNGTPVQNFPNFKLDKSRPDGTSRIIVHTLTIPAWPKYSEIKVVCLAFFTDESPTEETSPVTLTIVPDVPSSYDMDSACYSPEIIERIALLTETPTTTQVCKFCYCFIVICTRDTRSKMSQKCTLD